MYFHIYLYSLDFKEIFILKEQYINVHLAQIFLLTKDSGSIRFRVSKLMNAPGMDYF
jgi:hypothetical protein